MRFYRKFLLFVVGSSLGMAGCDKTPEGLFIVTNKSSNMICFTSLDSVHSHHVMVFDFKRDSVTSLDYYNAIVKGDTVQIIYLDKNIVENTYFDGRIGYSQRIRSINGKYAQRVIDDRKRKAINGYVMNKNGTRHK